YQTRGEGDLANCDTYDKIGGTEANATAGSEVAEVKIADTTAVITAKGESTVDSATFTLSPEESNNSLIWTQSGSCVAAGLC
ncbi:pilus assembly protein TapA, partial [Psychrobacter sp. 1Y4]